MTVGGTGQTTGEAAHRVHLEVAVTLISPVQIFGPVPVLFRLLVGSPASDEGHRHQFCSDCRLWFTHKSSKGCTGFLSYSVAGQHSRATGYRVLPVPECTNFRFSADRIHLHRVLPVPECCRFWSVPASYPVLTTDSPVQKNTGSGVLPVPESTSFTCTQNYRSRSASGSGVFAGSGVYQLHLYRELPVPECCRFQRVPASNPVLSTDSPVQRITSSGVLPVPECCLFRSVPASNPVLTTDPPVTEIYRFRSVTGS